MADTKISGLPLQTEFDAQGADTDFIEVSEEQSGGGYVSKRTVLSLLKAKLGLDSYQPLDSDLTAIAALTTTSFGRAFLALANEAAFKAAVNLEPTVDIPSLSQFTTLDNAAAKTADNETITGSYLFTNSGGIKIQGDFPSFLLSENGEKTAGVLLDSRFLQIHRKGVDFGAYESAPYLFHLDAGGSTIRAESSGRIGFGGIPDGTAKAKFYGGVRVDGGTFSVSGIDVITALAHVRPRQYPDASFPSASLYEGEQIYGTTTKKMYGSNGTSWNAFY